MSLQFGNAQFYPPNLRYLRGDPIFTWNPAMTLVSIAKGLVLGGWPLKIEVSAEFQVRRFDGNQKTSIRKSGMRSVARFYPS